MGNSPLWKGRLSGGLDEAFAGLNASIGFDKRLWPEDIRTNKAYLKALRNAGLVTADEFTAIDAALDDLRQDFEAGKVSFTTDLEDIHMHIEAALRGKASTCAEKIHTGRSRNDQVATDLRLFVKTQAHTVHSALTTICETLISRASRALDILFPAYTHLQRAQPACFAHWFIAYAHMFVRDRSRFAFAFNQADALPLGLGACTGSPFPVDREFLQNELHFSRLCRNSFDGVSDRDFVLDFLYAASCLFLHLSRFAEDLILYSSTEFGFVTLPDTLSTGSSMMPQKRNPDSLELARGKTGRIIGNLVSLITTLKGLPLTYNKDLQEDKEPLFDTVDTVISVLPMIHAVASTVIINRERCRAALEDGYLEATAVADYLTKKGVPFRTAYRITGGIVADLARGNKPFSALTPAEWKTYSEHFDDDIRQAVEHEQIVSARTGIGGTAPEAIEKEIERLRRELAATAGDTSP